LHRLQTPPLLSPDDVFQSSQRLFTAGFFVDLVKTLSKPLRLQGLRQKKYFEAPPIPAGTLSVKWRQSMNEWFIRRITKQNER
jgi:hypothetical protein